MRSRPKKSKKLFGLTVEQLKIITGGTGVIVQQPRET